MKHTKPRILILEESPAKAKEAAQALQQNSRKFGIAIVASHPEFMETLRSFQADAVISAYRLSGFDGLALKETLAYDESLPFILWTEPINELTAVECMKAGATDYVLKNQLTRLPIAVENALQKRENTLEKNKTISLLKSSEERFRRLAENAQDIIHRFSYLPEPHFEYINPAVTRITGYTPEDHYKDPLLGNKLIHPDDYHLFADFIRGEFSPDQPLTLRWIRKDGEIIWVEMRFTPIKNEKGEVIAVEGITRDISAWKRREEELERHFQVALAFYNTSLALRSAETIAEILPVFLNETLSIFNTENGAVCLYEKTKNALNFADCRGCFSRLSKGETALGSGIISNVLKSGEPFLACQFAEKFNLLADIDINLPPYSTFVCYPIKTTKETEGLLLLVIPDEEVTPSEFILLGSLTEMAGIAIHRINLFEQTVRRLKELQSLHYIDKAIAARLDINLLLNLILDHVLAQLNVDEARIYQYYPRINKLERVVVKGYIPGSPQHFALSAGEETAGRAVLQNKTIVTKEKSYYCIDIPLITENQIKGVLEVYIKNPLHKNAEWQNFLEIIAGQTAIAIANAQLFDDLQKANTELNAAYDATIEGWAHALDLRDHETEGHSRRVTEMTVKLAEAIGISGDELIHIRRGSLLHDIGKMAIPDAILLKPGELEEKDMAVMREHPRLAKQLLSRIPYLVPALDIPMYHHEKWDGTGYPNGLKGEEIPLAARIFAVVDVFDALTSERPYRPAWPQKKALRYLKEQSGKHFDPRIVKKFFQLFFPDYN